MRTYTSSRGLFSFFQETVHLYRIHRDDLPGKVSRFLRQIKICEDRVQQYTGVVLEGRDVLVIGPGQGIGEPTYFALKNRLTTIDLDVIAHDWRPGRYIAMWRQNGAKRTIKTLMRKCLGLDARSVREIKRQFGIQNFPPITHLQMDAAAMTFPENHFDFVYSFSVFEHLPDPEKVMQEIKRVLRPGGACYISLHSYTSDSGSHDVRVWTDNPPPTWAHLRPQHAAQIEANSYLNKLRLAEWVARFQKQMPGTHFEYDTHEPVFDGKLRAELAQLRAAGELKDYTDQELLTLNLVAVWKKPD